ncbi:hypothetical protein ABG768_018338, partial [Culter alburnus]
VFIGAKTPQVDARLKSEHLPIRVPPTPTSLSSFSAHVQFHLCPDLNQVQISVPKPHSVQSPDSSSSDK